jgi:hypothetical protein
MADPLQDPILAPLVEKAVAPYRALLTLSELEALRCTLAVHLAAQPMLTRALAPIRPRLAPLSSAEPAADAEAERALLGSPKKKAQGAG